MKNHKRAALIGLDGSGKSANIGKMKSDRDYSQYSFLWVRWKPTLLKPAYMLLDRKVKNAKTEEKRDNASEKSSAGQKALQKEYKAKSGLKDKVFKNPAIRAVWMALALIDYLLQFYAKTAGLLLKRESIIFDRFYLDLFVDQGINFGYSPEKIDSEIKRYQWLFPRMDQIVYIRVSPETCYKRKDDIPDMDYLLRRYAIYEQLSKNPGWVAVDGEKPFDEVNSAIKAVILG